MRTIVLILLIAAASSCTKQADYIPPITGDAIPQQQEQVEVLDTNKVIVFLNFDGDTNVYSIYRSIPLSASSMNDEQKKATLDSVRGMYSIFKNVYITFYNDKDWNLAPKKIKVDITSYGNTANSGVAVTNSYINRDHTPAIVMSSVLYNNPPYVAEAIAHEVGHCFGCHHQSLWNDSCRLLTPYNPGNDEEAPIMGAPFGKKARWWVGTSNLCCTCMQDDIAMIKSKGTGRWMQQQGDREVVWD